MYSSTEPLAARMLPTTLDELVGQVHIFGKTTYRPNFYINSPFTTTMLSDDDDPRLTAYTHKAYYVKYKQALKLCYN